MPELPEVENVRRELHNALADVEWIEAIGFSQHRLRDNVPRHQRQELVGQRFVRVDRRAKYLIFQLSRLSLINHLGMSGSWRFTDTLDLRPHDHAWMRLGRAGSYLIFNDPRRFGLFTTARLDELPCHPHLRHLGPEPLSTQWSIEYLRQKGRRPARPVKNWLMDQSVVVGIGNIYACETLFRARLSPLARLNRLAWSRIDTLIEKSKEVLELAIASGGTTFRDYRQASGRLGSFQAQLHVYGRDGQPCLVCAHPIQVKRLAGRSTFWCPACQKR